MSAITNTNKDTPFGIITLNDVMKKAEDKVNFFQGNIEYYERKISLLNVMGITVLSLALAGAGVVGTGVTLGIIGGITKGVIDLIISVTLPIFAFFLMLTGIFEYRRSDCATESKKHLKIKENAQQEIKKLETLETLEKRKRMIELLKKGAIYGGTASAIGLISGLSLLGIKHIFWG